MGNNYSTQTLKVKSRMGSQRIKAHISKKENMLVKGEREIAKLISEGKIQSARIKVEGVVREENLIRVMEWLDMMCDLMHQRVKQIEATKVCPEDLCESICTILYCAKRVNIPELTEVGGQFRAKWGDKWFAANIENRSGRVSKQIVEKLSPQPPRRETVDKKMKQICDKFDIVWEQVDDGDDVPAFVGHRNEYTIEFTSKPFGMEWTATQDGQNLWVSNVTPMSQAARAGVVPGSMLVAFNGIDIQNLGAADIHGKASQLGLPLRVTFCKPDSLDAPKKKGDFSVREDVVNACVAKLKQPMALDWSPEQRAACCKKIGANPAETASAIFLASYIVEHQQQQQQQQQKQQNQNRMQPVQPMQPVYQQPMYQQPQQPYMQPMQPQQPMQPMQPMQPNMQQPMNMNNMNGMNNMNMGMNQQFTPMQPQQPGSNANLGAQQQQQYPSPQQPNNDNNNAVDLTDLEARFAALQK